jgi:heme a synthase
MRARPVIYLIRLTLGIALIVLLLGVYTRLMDAGLGCPDWPGCYGKLILSTVTDHQFNVTKAWIEMIHRYAAATLSLLILSIAIPIIYQRLPGRKICFLLLGLLCFQALLGKWTVTLRLLPIVVLAHLIGGFGILSLLWILLLKFNQSSFQYPSSSFIYIATWIGLIFLIIQILLGGWTSTNYAAFNCPDFPTCQGQWWPHADFKQGFRIGLSATQDYSGGVLSHDARTAIAIAHRLGACILTVYLLTLTLLIARHRTRRKLTFIMLSLLGCQILLGILNIKWLLPIPIALAHNGVAALLLLSLITLTTKTYPVQRISA